ncbi:carbon-monoxide dehydrogenase small subunit [Dethiosulfatibacter aminovorans DSM 17477]|uniref:Carbon-monoxide dehydrogenase small subunit n=1 Tax=Dethiosulfatibacter aminovorans DSM 17477 TaxID=1121476 RepID=A0A1M6HBT1_9FIRM|nr:(2Fe-2S)-binding protein [Dethiosulfatibacter aminovorans]SHJ19662.1 carbon-monoxide dehydrogenase small subunit [Dethiosulfatibacter aminovorans DSM 17477]
MIIEFKLNGEDVKVETGLAMRLLDVIRNDFGLTGTKEGCAEGECGACIVFLDGMIVNSCMVPMNNVMGKEVVTIEGFSRTERYKKIEKAFMEEGAVQCGFCTPGMVMATEGLLRLGISLTEEDIKKGLSGNICRCTGYEAIYRAVRKLTQEAVLND